MQLVLWVTSLKKKDLSKYCDVAIYSLNGNKNFTAGAGGLMSTDIFKYHNFAKNFANNGKNAKAYNYQMIGFNFNMSSLNGALALAQVKRFHELNENKVKIRNLYRKYLSPIKLFNSDFIWGKYFPWLNFFLTKTKEEKKKMINVLRKNSILVNDFWLPMHKHPIKKHFILTKYPNTNYIYDRILVLPSSTFLLINDIKKITKLIKKI